MPCWARRLSRRAFDVFFLGTAMSGRRVYQHASDSLSRSRRLSEPIAELGERLPARIGCLLLVLVGLDVQILAAHRTEPGAVGTAEDLLGQRERERVTR